MDRLKVETILLVFICLMIVAMSLFPLALGLPDIDIHVHDTYYILSGFHVAILLLVYCLLLLALYKILRRKIGSVSFLAGLLHIGITVFSISAFFSNKYFAIYGHSRYYAGYGGFDTPVHIDFQFIITTLFIVAQAGFFFYFFVEWFRKRRRQW